MEIFEKDVKDAERILNKEIKWGRIYQILTFGLFSNSGPINVARQQLEKCKADAEKYGLLRDEAKLLDEQLERVIEIKGVRVSKNAFPDHLVLGGETYPLDWENLRETILVRDNHQCTHKDGYCCGTLQIHHIIPLSRGGSNNPSNLTTLCYYHHSLMHDHMKANKHGNIWR